MHNPNAYAANITEISDAIGGYAADSITCAGVASFPFVLEAGATIVCEYCVCLPDATPETTGANTATVVVGDMLGTDCGVDNATASAAFDFAAATVELVDEDATVTNSCDGAGAPVQLDAEALNGSPFTQPVTCYANFSDCGVQSLDFSATLVAGDSGATASDSCSTPVNVTSTPVELEVCTSALASYDRTYTWDISKTCPADFNILVGATIPLSGFQWTASATHVDSNFKVSELLAGALSHVLALLFSLRLRLRLRVVAPLLLFGFCVSHSPATRARLHSLLCILSSPHHPLLSPCFHLSLSLCRCRCPALPPDPLARPQVCGTIKVSNPSAFAALIADVTSVVGAAAGDVDCGVAFPYTLAAGGTLVCDYCVQLDSATDGSVLVNVEVTDLDGTSTYPMRACLRACVRECVRACVRASLVFGCTDVQVRVRLPVLTLLSARARRRGVFGNVACRCCYLENASVLAPHLF